MSEANCFIMLAHAQASVKPGDRVSEQVFDAWV